MGRRERVRQLAELFHQAESAFHHYEQEVLEGDRDIYWPEWYADYLIGHGLDLLMEDRLASELLAGFLLRCKADHKACGSRISWEEFAAMRMVEKMV